MKKRVTVLMLVVVMLVSMVAPAIAAAPIEYLKDHGSNDVLLHSDLTAISEEIGGPEHAASDAQVTQREAALFLLSYAGLKDSQLGETADDYDALIKSVALTNGMTYSASAPCTVGNFNTMYANVAVICDAMNADVREPLFINGMAQPIFAYDEAIRFCVYVETNYDTDGDGKLDLVKALVQLPGDVLNGMEVATIYEARPYITGTNTGSVVPEDILREDGYDISSMYAQPAGRTPAGSKTTGQAAEEANPDDWYYYNPYEEAYVFEDLEWYDYYLVRGFAVVEAGGLGTKGSEGFGTCGSDLEIDAFKCIIEWLTGDRVAYTDLKNNIEIKADWSNGKIGMTGRSYAGTTQFGLATTGVKGLETIVPVAGIASWYEYTNSQGISTRTGVNYTDGLAWYCTGRYQDADDYATIADKYGNYLYQLQLDQWESNGDYSDHWKIRDYTIDWAGIECPALIVHGLNDDNVRTKQSIMMYEAYEKAGADVKLMLHQGAHLTPTFPSRQLEMYIDDMLYDEILNKWFSHYLYGVNNGIENMAAVTHQSNVDGSWHYYDDWNTAISLELNASDLSSEKSTTISSDIAAIGVDRTNWRDKFTAGSTASSAMYTATVVEDTLIKGTVEVNVRASTDAIGKDAIMLSAMLVDIDKSGFKAYNNTDSGSQVHVNILKEGGAWMGGGLKNFDLFEFAPQDVTYKIIARGWMDMYNPDAGFDSATATARTELKAGEFYDYTLYLQPNLYTVEEGHTLALVIYTYEPGRANYENNYTITIDNENTSVEIPVNKKVADPVSFFSDVSASDWFYSDVVFAKENGLMEGVGNNLFAPYVDTSRAMIVTLLWRLEGSPLETEKSSFKDIESGSWYEAAVAWAAKNNLVNGYNSDTFGPNDTITREQFATILYRYAQFKGYDISKTNDLAAFGDANAVSEYAVVAVKWAVANGLINGIDSKLVPADGANRAQAAALFHRFVTAFAD